MDDELVLLVFMVHCDRQMPFVVWLWFMDHLTAMRKYHRQTVLRSISFQSHQQQEATVKVIAPGYTYWGTEE
jgi:hypothetical protein